MLLWLLPAAPASAELFVNKSFAPANVAPAQASTLTIQILNNTSNPATGVGVTDTLPSSPAGLRIGPSGLISNSCGGTVTATAGAATVTLAGGAVAAAAAGTAGSCAIAVQVVATPAASPSSTVYINTIPPANVTSSIGGGSSTVTASLSVAPINPLTGTITFTPGVVKGDGAAARMRITLTNPNSYALTAAAFTNTLQTQLARSATPNATTTCSGGTVGGSTTTVTLAGAGIPANGSCYVEVDVIARTPAGAQNGSVTNSIVAGNVTTDQRVTNSAAISGSVTVQTGAAVAKAFAATLVGAGQSTTLTITVTNYRAVAVGPFSLTDTLPTNLVTSGAGTTTCTGGSVATTSGAVTLSGATLAAAPAAASGGTSCTITVAVLSNVDGSYTNTIPAGTIAGTSFGSASATLAVTSTRGTKAFSPATIPRSGTSVLTIRLFNRNTGSAAAISSFSDALTTMGADITIASSPAATNGCGGTLSAAAGSTSISLSGGTIPIATSSSMEGSCTITVPVVAGVNAATTTRTNTIAIGGLQTSNGNNASAFAAQLSIVAPLTVATSFPSTTVVAGATTTVTVTVTRAANGALLSNLSLADTLPSGFVVAPAPGASTTCAGGSVAATPGASSFSLSGGNSGTTVANASSCSVTINVVAPAATGSYTNTIPVGAVTAMTDQGSVSNLSAASASVNVIGSVSLNTAFSPTNIYPGGTSRLSVFISNPIAVGALTGVVLTDALPSGLVVKTPANATLVASSGSCTGTIEAVAGSGTVRITGGAVSAGAECELSFDVTTDSIGTLSNVLSPGALTSTQGYSNANSASATLVSVGSAEVSITKTDGVAQLTAGTATTYTLVATNNNGSLAVRGLPVTDAEPSGMTFTSWTCAATSGSACRQASGTGGVATQVDLAPLGKATFQVVARLASGFTAAQVTNTATVNPSAAGVSDPDSSNDTASDVDNVVRSGDLSLTKTISNPSPRIGERVTFTLTVADAGPSDSADVVVSDPLPSGYDFVSATPSAGTFSAPDWRVGPVAAGSNATLAIVATVKRTGDRTNTANATTSTPDPVAGNNGASVTPTIIGLAVAKTSTILSDPENGTVRPKATPGAIVEYRITISNETGGAVDADSIAITDLLPAQVCVRVVAPAVTMIEGSPPSGLLFSPTSDIAWTSQSGGGAPFTYTPVADATGCDPLVTGVRIGTRGQIAPGTASAPTSATFVLRARIK